MRKMRVQISFRLLPTLLLAVALFVVLLVKGNTDAEAAASFSEESWSSTGIGTRTVTTNDTTKSVIFHYNHSAFQGDWTYSTVATATETVSYKWKYSGLHSWFLAHASITAFVNHLDGTTSSTLLLNQGVSSDFYFEGISSFQVKAGETYGYILHGDNYDSSKILSGNLEIYRSPKIVPTVSGTIGANGWYTSDVSIDWAVTEPSSLEVTKSGCGPVSVTADTPGTTFTCTAASAGGTTSKDVTLKRDTIAPTITLNGSGTTYHEVNTPYTDLGISEVTDNFTSVVPVTVEGSVNANVPGTYTLNYRAVDDAGNIATSTRTVIVKDMTPPVITLNGSSTVDHEVKTAFTDEGAEATDNYDSIITITTTDTVKADEVGTYTLTYTATDAAGNSTASVTRTVYVRDTIAPIIQLNGASTINIEMNTPYTDLGAIATDNYDSNITITTASNVDVTTPGKYAVSYTAVDSSGNIAAEVTRNVNVHRSGNDILSFEIPLLQTKPTIIDSNNHTVTVEVYHGTDRTGLHPVITLSGGAKVLEPHGNTVNFLSPVDYQIQAESGTIQNWLVTVNEALSGDARLSSLTLGAASLNEAFEPDKFTYTASVANNVYFTNIFTELSSPLAALTLKVNDLTQSVTDAVYLKVGANKIALSVFAQNGNTEVYQITVNRVGSSNADISSITYMGEQVEQADRDFLLTIGPDTDEVALQVFLSDPHASLSVSQAVYSNNWISVKGLSFGTTTLNLEVVAEDNATIGNYRLHITRSDEAPVLQTATADVTGRSVRLTFHRSIGTVVDGGKMSLISGVSNATVSHAVYDLADPTGRTVIVELNKPILLGDQVRVFLEPGFVRTLTGMLSDTQETWIHNHSQFMDTDGDAEVTIKDAVILFGGLQEDLNGDGKVDRLDILWILNQIKPRIIK